MSLHRRKFLAAGSGVLLSGQAFQNGHSHSLVFDKKPRVAVIMTVMTYRSHAHVIIENFLHHYMFNGIKTDPGVEVVSFYVDQMPSDDMAAEVAKKFNIPIFSSIDQAICCGTNRPQVDAVLLIGEHGNYPYDQLGRHQYPRKRFFDETISAIRKGKTGIPIFNDKHLSYRWDWTKEIYDVARKQNCPLMAGSSVPLAQRIPNLELQKGCQLDEAIAIHGGGIESYDFHGLEVLQSMIENRQGGETGVAQLQFLDSNQLKTKIAGGKISRQLFDAAMKTVDPEKKLKFDEVMHSAHGILLKYRDGLQGACIGIKEIKGTRWPFACRLKGDPNVQACRFFVGPWRNRNLFKALSHAIQQHFRQKRAPYPVERTLLTSGIVNLAMESRFQGGKLIPTPELDIRYQASDFRKMREMGATWKRLTPDTPQPKGLFNQFDEPSHQ